MRDILKRAIETYGAEAQLNVAIEELSELIKEICKHKRGAKNAGAIIEEMADCYIMLQQMEMIFGLGSTVISDAMELKVNRLKKRLEESEIVYCKDCKHLMYSDCYGECGKGYRGIVYSNDHCDYGERSENGKRTDN